MKSSPAPRPCNFEKENAMNAQTPNSKGRLTQVIGAVVDDVARMLLEDACTTVTKLHFALTRGPWLLEQPASAQIALAISSLPEELAREF